MHASSFRFASKAFCLLRTCAQAHHPSSTLYAHTDIMIYPQLTQYMVFLQVSAARGNFPQHVVFHYEPALIKCTQVLSIRIIPLSFLMLTQTWWWLFPRLRGFWENVPSFIPIFAFFF